MKVFVAGATGVIGRRAVRLLIEAGHEVTAVARQSAERLAAAGASPRHTDLFDVADVRSAVAGHDAVIDVATSIPPTGRMAFAWAWRTNDRLRREASRNLADAVLDVGGGVYVRESVALVYADAGDAWIDEEGAVDPPRLSRSALDAEDSARSVTARGGTGVALRFGMLYGPDASHTRDVVTVARRLGVAPLIGSPEGYESWLHVDDAASAAVAALGVPDGVYNVADAAPRRRREHAQALASALGRPLRLPPTWLARLGPLRQRDRSLRLGTTRFQHEADWSPTYPTVDEGWPSTLADLDG